MSLKTLSPVLMVDDVGRTVAFYVDELAFTFLVGVPEGSQESVTAWPAAVPLAFAMVKRGNVTFMFQTRGSLADEFPRLENAKIGGSLVLYIECDDLDAVYGRLREDMPFVKDVHTTFYGMREFTIRDLNGYYLTFAQRAGA